MLSVYIGTGLVGIVLIVLAGVSGFLDGDIDAGGGIDHDVHLEADHGHGFDFGWVPFLSLRFWTYAAAGFGLTGTIFSLTKMLDARATFIVSLVLGLLMGFGVFALMRFAKKNQTELVPSASTVVGLHGKLLVGVGATDPGKVRVQVNGEWIDYLARSQSALPIPAGHEVVVVGVDDAVAYVESVQELYEEESDLK